METLAKIIKVTRITVYVISMVCFAFLGKFAGAFYESASNEAGRNLAIALMITCGMAILCLSMLFFSKKK